MTHQTNFVNGYNLFTNSEDAKKLTKYALECVKLNGGEATIESETVVIHSSNVTVTINYPHKEENGIPAEIMGTVFRYFCPKDILEKARNLWKEIENADKEN